MKQIAGVWLPDHETHLVELFAVDPRRIDGRATYQHTKIERALSYVTDFGFAIDVGAHVGLWTLQLAKRFGVVMAIEPSAENFECLQANATTDNVRLRRCALGDVTGAIETEVLPGSSGDTFVAPGGPVTMWRLDDLGDIGSPGFVKLDCVGYELPALVGMQELLIASKPVICVEQKPGRAERYGFEQLGAIEYLKSLGYVERENMNGVFVLTWEGK